MHAPVKVALVGYGLAGSVFHAPLIEATPGLSLAAVVTSDERRREAAERRYPTTPVVPTVDALPLSPDRFDLAVIATPNATHFALAEAALEAGIHVVVDKPVTTTSGEAESLSDLARRRGRSFIPYHNRRWDGDYLTVSDLVRSDRLGRILRFESRFERWRPGPPAVRSWKHDAALGGAGILYDLGSHLIDQALNLFGAPSSVYAERSRHNSSVDDDTFVALRYPAGPAVHIWVSSNAADLAPRFRVLGSERAYVKYGLDPQEEALRAGRSPTEIGWGEEAKAAWGRIGTPDGTAPVATRPGAYQDFYAAVAAHLTAGAPPPVDDRDAVAGIRVIEAAAESARSGRTVDL